MLIFILSILTSNCVYIKQLNTDLYLSFEDKYSKNVPILVNINSASLFNITKQNNENLIRSKNINELVFDIEKKNNKLLMWKYHGGKNQKFTFEPRYESDNKSKIMNKNMCLTFQKNKKWYELRPCSKDDNDINQVFEFIKESEIDNKKENIKDEKLADSIKTLDINKMENNDVKEANKIDEEKIKQDEDKLSMKNGNLDIVGNMSTNKEYIKEEVKIENRASMENKNMQENKNDNTITSDKNIEQSKIEMPIIENNYGLSNERQQETSKTDMKRIALDVKDIKNTLKEFKLFQAKKNRHKHKYHHKHRKYFDLCHEDIF